MECYDEGILQAYLDQELSNLETQKISLHLKKCENCSKSLHQLEDQDRLISNIFNYDNAIPPISEIEVYKNRKNRRIIKMNKNAKKIVAAVAGIVVFSSAIVFQPAVASSVLKLFRMDNMQTVSINKDDLSSLNSIFRDSGNTKVDIQNFIKADSKVTDEYKSLDKPSKSEVINFFNDSKLLELTNKYSFDGVSRSPEKNITFSINGTKANEFLETIGEKTMFPIELSDKEIHATFYESYSGSIVIGDNTIQVEETKFPKFDLPSGVDEDKMIKSLFSMNIIPKELQAQLLSINNPLNTIPIPYMSESETKREVDVDGNKAIVIATKTKEYSYARAYFKLEDRIFTLSGEKIDDEALNILKELVK